MSPGSDAHCCNAGKCKKPVTQSSQECNRLHLNQLTASPEQWEQSAAFAVTTPITNQIAALLSVSNHESLEPLMGESPPDLPILHASLLI